MIRNTVLSLCFALNAADRFAYSAKVSEIEDLTHDTKRIRFRLIDVPPMEKSPGPIPGSTSIQSPYNELPCTYQGERHRGIKPRMAP